MLKLVPFSKSNVSVTAQLVDTAPAFVLTFELSGAEAVIFPQKEIAPTRKDELWKETCFECFFGVKDSSAYYEFNGSPSGNWALYEFDSYRAGMRNVELKSPSAVPVLTAAKNSIQWKIPKFTDAPLSEVSITAVLKTPAETSYWAIKHVGDRADFHLRESFSLKL